MNKSSGILIFDIGKTNKKVLLLDESYQVIYENADQLAETEDEDGFPCEDIHKLTEWVLDSFAKVTSLYGSNISAVNCSAYGASLVHINSQGKPIAPLYNYLKPYPASLQEKLYEGYGGEENFSLNTSSPSLGSLNSGLQLYRLKMVQPGIFEKINYSLHLPQYISSLFSGNFYSDLTSIGCHTALWDFKQNNYHKWVNEESIIAKLAPIHNGSHVSHFARNQRTLLSGIGLHDSSAALLPYLQLGEAPFLLISTGTWCISLNPYNKTPLTKKELQKDCLCYLTASGKPVKASRLFAGKWHEEQVLRMAEYFHLEPQFFSTIRFDSRLMTSLKNTLLPGKLFAPVQTENQTSDFSSIDLDQFSSPEMAYHHFMHQLVTMQTESTNLVLKNSTVENIYVDGGFSKNELFMQLLAQNYPDKAVFGASIAQASALGAAMIIHSQWNASPFPGNHIILKRYHQSKSVL